MNRCSKSGIHEHSPKSQIHIQIFQRIVRLSSIEYLDDGDDGFHVMRCGRRYLELVGPCRFCILLTFFVNRRTGSVCKGLPPRFTVLGNKIHPYSTKSQPQDCGNLLNLILLDSMGFTASFPSHSQGMYLLVALEKSTLR